MTAALDNFQQIRAERKMMILGDMRELGEESSAEHQRIVDKARESGAEVWLVGELFAQAKHDFRTFRDVEEVKQELQSHPIEGRTILIKGSNGTRLYQLPEFL